MSGDGMAGQVRRLRQVTDILGWAAEDQLTYLRELGVGGVVDELALQFDDSYRVLAELRRRDLVSHQAEEALAAVDVQLSAMSNGDLWSERSVRDAPEWMTVRSLAKRALSLL
jgi:hypothetical protein